MARVFLYAPQDFRNLCAISRTLEVFGQEECFVFDPHRLIRERYGKSRAREHRVVSAGAFAKIRWNRVEEPERFLPSYPGRVVATVADADASVLTRYRFDPDDLLLFGSEAQGLPASIVTGCSGKVTIRAHGRTQSLNLAVALGVVLFECERQREPPQPTSLSDAELESASLEHRHCGPNPCPEVPDLSPASDTYDLPH